jgi:threonyl-tRNA synthetase
MNSNLKRAFSIASNARRRIDIFSREQEKFKREQNCTPLTFVDLVWKSSSGTPNINTSLLSQLPSTVPSTWRPVEAIKYLPSSIASTPSSPIIGVKIDGISYGISEPIGTTTITQLQGKKREIEFIRFDSTDGKRLFWHSAAHILGAALESEFGDQALLTDGPAISEDQIESGFFYELHLSRNRNQLEDPRILESTLPLLETAAKKIVSLNAPFERLLISRSIAYEMFNENPFKLEIISRIPPDEALTLYRCGPFVDLCRGPHVQNTGIFKAIRFFKTSGSHWKSATNSSNSSTFLQRVYGTAFPTSAQLVSWQATVDEAKRRDHRVIGNSQKLFFFHKLSPGSVFLLPHGTRIYNRLVSMLRNEYRLRGYEEVRSPLVYKNELWRISGHLEAYAENMFSVAPGLGESSHVSTTVPSSALSNAAMAADAKSSEATDFQSIESDVSSSLSPNSIAVSTDDHDHDHEHEALGLKPMNCPGHCLIFAHRQVSYKDLPIRLADFSALHRNEASGALGGLTRLRRFAQDDAHIFCAEDHIEAEVTGCLNFVVHVYKLFGFTFRTKLSTRPSEFVGDIATWDRAEIALKSALRSFLITEETKKNAHLSNKTTGTNNFQISMDIDIGGGAFYGPKVDVFVRDALGREHQCATVQLDFQLPNRFNLSFKSSSNEDKVPVIIHRAILGSIERMMGVLIEHTAGKWPFWLSPRQIVVCPVSERHVNHAKFIAELLMREEIRVANGSQNESKLFEDTSLFVDVDDSARTVNKKVRDAQVSSYNLIVVVGDTEVEKGNLAMRFRDAATYLSFIEARNSILNTPKETNEFTSSPILPTTTTKVLSEDSVIPENRNEWKSPLVTISSVEELRSICRRMMLLRI